MDFAAEAVVEAITTAPVRARPAPARGDAGSSFEDHLREAAPEAGAPAGAAAPLAQTDVVPVATAQAIVAATLSGAPTAQQPMGLLIEPEVSAPALPIQAQGANGPDPAQRAEVTPATPNVGAGAAIPASAAAPAAAKAPARTGASAAAPPAPAPHGESTPQTPQTQTALPAAADVKLSDAAPTAPNPSETPLQSDAPAIPAAAQAVVVQQSAAVAPAAAIIQAAASNAQSSAEAPGVRAIPARPPSLSSARDAAAGRVAFAEPETEPAVAKGKTSDPPGQIQKAAVSAAPPVSGSDSTQLARSSEGDASGQQMAALSAPASAAQAQHATPAEAAARAASPHAQLAREIVRRFDGESTRFELRLDPPELGRVDVRLDVTRDHRVTAVVAADTPQALSELARHARDLTLTLQSAGLELAENGLSFDLRQSGGQAGMASEAASSSAAAFATEDESPLPTQARPLGFELWRGVRVDLMV